MAEANYTIEALAKGLSVLAALEGSNFEAVTIQTVCDRTKLPYNYCFRALKTLESEGFAKETEGKRFILGPKVVRLSERFTEQVAG